MQNTYDIGKPFDWNYDNGPVYNKEFPPVPQTPQKDFLGHPVNSRLGIAAGLLLNSRWIKTYSRLGFDILTYKTVRSQYRPCQELPNWVFVKGEKQIDPLQPGETQELLGQQPDDYRKITSSVSFGMPSKDPAEWMADVETARKALGRGQVLIVSVVASPGENSPVSEMVEDFGRLAAMAREAGAQVIEANLSCPNVCTAEGDIFLDAELSGEIAGAMHKNANGLPLLLKLGHFAKDQQIREVLQSVQGKASGVVMVNGVSRRVVDERGNPAFGRGREMSGILGRGIHAFSLDNVRSALAIVERERLPLEIIAVGGIAESDDAAPYFRAGAAAVMMGSAPMFDPHLAIGIKRQHPEW